MALGFALVRPAAVDAQRSPIASPLAASCRTSGAKDFATAPDAPTHVHEARLIAAVADKPAEYGVAPSLLNGTPEPPLPEARALASGLVDRVHAVPDAAVEGARSRKCHCEVPEWNESSVLQGPRS